MGNEWAGWRRGFRYGFFGDILVIIFFSAVVHLILFSWWVDPNNFTMFICIALSVYHWAQDFLMRNFNIILPPDTRNEEYIKLMNEKKRQKIKF